MGGREGRKAKVRKGARVRSRPSAYDLNMLSRSGHRRDKRGDGEKAGKLSSERAHSRNSRAPHLNQSRGEVGSGAVFWSALGLAVRPSLRHSVALQRSILLPPLHSLASFPIHNVRRERRRRRGRLTPFSICTAVATFEPQWHRMIYDPRIHFRRRDANQEGGRGGGRRCTDTGSHGYPFHIRTIVTIRIGA